MHNGGRFDVQSMAFNLKLQPGYSDQTAACGEPCMKTFYGVRTSGKIFSRPAILESQKVHPTNIVGYLYSFRGLFVQS